MISNQLSRIERRTIRNLQAAVKQLGWDWYKEPNINIWTLYPPSGVTLRLSILKDGRFFVDELFGPKRRKPPKDALTLLQLLKEASDKALCDSVAKQGKGSPN
ncbi:hypothetical protein AMR42_04910 [Limnothrix sp. PR1529]|uniref:hypothetical protein n=1 Tax=Limnothrix sp. PR1529 TaxID=1704291 RepID=UPI00081F2560|nr:hypothetical protein [Limnothrix sp. PR1529]OCQ98526.1 hypothetical protein BCR12_02485 [Limnothrix sp. P13C2]PIB14676.1 hypothetical protein AMR42_04910 [Limnothrix sp. PR1529]